MPRRDLKKAPTKSGKNSVTKKPSPKPSPKVYVDFFDVQKNAPRKVGTVVKTKKGISYEFISNSPLIWEKK